MSLRTTVLENGLRLALEERDYPGVAFQLLIPAAGAVQDTSIQGAASLLEAWIWKGAGDLEAQALAQALDRLGVRRQSGVGLEYAVFSAAFLPEVLEEVFRLYAELFRRPWFPDSAFEAVRSVALQELAALEDQPSRELLSLLRRKVFLSPHGQEPLGREEDLKRATPEAVRKEVVRYTPKGAILAVAGGVEWERLLLAVEPLLAWKGEDFSYPAPQLSGPRAFRVRHPTAQVQIGLAYRDVGPEDEGFYPARLALEVLSGGMASRLFTEVREKRGLAYAVSAFPLGVKGQGLLVAYAGTTKERYQKTLEVLKGEIRRLQEGISEEELSRSKVALRTSLILGDESVRSRAGSMARDLYLLGRVRPLQELEERIEGVSLEEVNGFLARHPYEEAWEGLLGEVEDGA